MFDPWSGKSNQTCVPRLVSLCSRARASQEKPSQWEACTLQLESCSRSPQLEKSPCSNKDRAQPKINKLKKKKKTYTSVALLETIFPPSGLSGPQLWVYRTVFLLFPTSIIFMAKITKCWLKISSHILIPLIKVIKKVKMESLSRGWLFVTPWSVAYQAPLSMGFSRQEYWSGLPHP